MISESLKQYSRSINMTSNKKYFKLNMTKRLLYEFKFYIDREYYKVQDIFQRQVLCDYYLIRLVGSILIF